MLFINYIDDELLDRLDMQLLFINSIDDELLDRLDLQLRLKPQINIKVYQRHVFFAWH